MKQKFPTLSFRLLVVQASVYAVAAVILLRLGYWQVIMSAQLQGIAQAQYTSIRPLQGSRGTMLFRDGSIFVGNTQLYTLFVQPQILRDDLDHIATQLAERMVSDIPDDSIPISTRSAQSWKEEFRDKLSQTDKKWVALAHRISAQRKQKIQDLRIYGIGFDAVDARFYPEASMAAHISGFVGKNNDGEDTGYFGIEGELDRELRGTSGKVVQEVDAHGAPIVLEDSAMIADTDGRDVTLTIQKDLQYMLEKKLQAGMRTYGAKSGEAVIMDPKTGEIFAMASFPQYDQQNFTRFNPELYKNPLVAEAYEPGSTFKVLTIAAGIDAGVIAPDTQCDRCATARKISGYTIKTWNDQYTANITMQDALTKSDNTAMIFVAERLGEEKFRDYLSRFKIGEKSGVELQEDSATPIRKDWKLLDLATSSFGQGIATTGLQMVKAVGAIANDGVMVRPRLVHAVRNGDTQHVLDPEVVGTPISKATAQTVTKMMVDAAAHGEAKWAVLKKYSIAGKTGTAQIPVEGHYDAEKTIASFIGFAPADDPRFVMLVKLREPSSSQWAAETAAPLWYDIAEELFIRLNILPDKE